MIVRDSQGIAKLDAHELIREAADGCEPIHVTNRDGRKPVIVCEEQWRSPEDTPYLHSIPGMAASVPAGLETPVSACEEYTPDVLEAGHDAAGEAGSPEPPREAPEAEGRGHARGAA